MKSKISFFNKTIFRKNVTLFWPIWGAYLLFLLISQPGILWLEYSQNQLDGGLADSVKNAARLMQDNIASLEIIMNMPLLVIQTAVMAVITVMAVFHYLCVAKNTNMVHALPVTRTELFGTNVISGLVFMYVPQILSFFLMMAVCLANGMTKVEYIGTFVLLEMGLSLLWCSMAVFCTMMTGQMFAIPVFFLVVNLLELFLRILVQGIAAFYSYGVNLRNIFIVNSCDICSPIFYLVQRLDVILRENDRNFIDSMEFVGISYVAVYLLAAVAFLVIAFLLYQKRQLECAGDFVVFGFARPLFRWGISFFAAYAMGAAVYLIGVSISEEYKFLPVFLAGILGAVITFFIAQMILEKNFRVFQKRCCIECGAMVAFVVVTYLGIRLFACYEEQYVPEKDNIRCASLEIAGYEFDQEKEDYGKVLELQEELVKYKDRYGYKGGGLDYDDIYYSLCINYQLGDGRDIYRRYYVPMDFEKMDMVHYFEDMLWEPEQFLERNFGVTTKDEVPEVWGNPQIYGGEDYDEYCFLKEEYGEQEFKVLTPQEQQMMAELWNAVVADAKVGTLQKYDEVLCWNPQEDSFDQGIRACLSISWAKPTGVNSTEENINDWDYWEGEYHTINFGPDCENICKVLEKYHVVDDVSKLFENSREESREAQESTEE